MKTKLLWPLVIFLVLAVFLGVDPHDPGCLRRRLVGIDHHQGTGVSR